jgi:ribosomal protein S1
MMTEARQRFLRELQPGEVLKGVVHTVTDFGVYVDLGPCLGLVTVVNLAWERFDHPSQVVDRVGQELTVVVLNVDLEREEVSLSLKDLQPDPLALLARTRFGQVVQGPVTKTTPIGVFVRVGENVEGLLSSAELERGGETRRLQVGDTVQVQVAGINLSQRRVALSLP